MTELGRDEQRSAPAVALRIDRCAGFDQRAHDRKAAGIARDPQRRRAVLALVRDVERRTAALEQQIDDASVAILCAGVERQAQRPAMLRWNLGRR